MPIVDAAIIAACRAQIDTDFGPIPSQLSPAQIAAIDNRRERLAEVVARSGQYVRDNAQVNVGQDVIVPASGLLDGNGHVCSGTAHGTVDTTGTIS